MMTELEQKAIDEIMDWFDFDRVCDVMTKLDWRWCSGDETYVPSVQEIRASARNKLRSLVNDNLSRTSSGGLNAEYDRENKVMSLEFVLYDWDVVMEEIDE